MAKRKVITQPQVPTRTSELGITINALKQRVGQYEVPLTHEANASISLLDEIGMAIAKCKLCPNSITLLWRDCKIGITGEKESVAISSLDPVSHTKLAGYLELSEGELTKELNKIATRSRWWNYLYSVEERRELTKRMSARLWANAGLEPLDIDYDKMEFTVNGPALAGSDVLEYIGTFITQHTEWGFAELPVVRLDFDFGMVIIQDVEGDDECLYLNVSTPKAVH